MKTLILLFAILSLTACKKDEQNFPDHLIGTWNDIQYQRNGWTGECDVKFSKVTDDRLKMEVLSGAFNGDAYIINADGNGVNLHIYTQNVYNNNKQYVVSGSGTTSSNSFRLDLTRSGNGQTESVAYIGD